MCTDASFELKRQDNDGLSSLFNPSAHMHETEQAEEIKRVCGSACNNTKERLFNLGV
ncbi:MAG: hypothetical protein OEY11_04810 [Gammaproteobacteria bacterium]|nr:hypothetical protein [Gammaproteobacteria bacterium]